MGILDDYGSLLDDPLRAKKAFMPPGTVPPRGPYASFNIMDQMKADRAAPRGMDFGTGSPGFPPTKMDWKPAAPTADSSVAKLQDRLGSGPDTSSFDLAQTFSP